VIELVVGAGGESHLQLVVHILSKLMESQADDWRPTPFNPGLLQRIWVISCYSEPGERTQQIEAAG